MLCAISAAVLLALALAAITLFGWLWPSYNSFSQLELLWIVAPGEVEKERIWRLVLPLEALDFGAQGPPPSTTQGVVQRVSESVGVARLLSPDGRRQQSQAWVHTWTFRPTTESARDRTPLLVFINRASGGRQGEATLVHLRALLSDHQASACCPAAKLARARRACALCSLAPRVLIALPPSIRHRSRPFARRCQCDDSGAPARSL